MHHDEPTRAMPPPGHGERGLTAVLLQALDSVPVLVSSVDARERYLFCNRTYEEWFGHTRAQLLGRPVREVVGEAAYRTLEPHLRAVQAGRLVHFEQVVPYRTAGFRRVRVTYAPHPAEADGTRGFSALVEDVTEQRRREEAIRNSEALRLAVLGSSDAVGAWDLGAGTLEWSGGLSTLFGHTPPPPQEGLAWWRRHVHPDDVARVEEALRAAVAGGGETHRSEYRLRRADGSWADVTSRAVILRGPEGRAERVVLAVQDDTERLELLRTVRRRSAELEGVLQAVPEPVWVVGPRRVRLANPAARAFGGLRPDGPLPPDWRRAYARLRPRDPDTGAPLAEGDWIIERALTGQAGRREKLLRALGPGEDRVMLVSAAPAASGPGEPAAVVVMLDVTERRRSEARLRQAADFRDLFVGVVSHDLRTPLQAVALSARALLADAGLGPGARRHAERVLGSAQRMTGMISQLLDFVRGRLGGGIPVVRAPGDLVDVVRGVLRELEASAPPVRLHVLGHGRGSWDRDRLAQVVQNLVGNAQRHGTPGTVHVDVDGRAPDVVVLEVRNQGPPIPPGLLGELFEPFRQGLGTPGTPAGEGLGLGLFITRDIVRGHGGEVNVCSTEPEGTCFTVRLPRQTP